MDKAVPAAQAGAGLSRRGVMALVAAAAVSTSVPSTSRAAPEDTRLECNEQCQSDRTRVILERRAMMQQSRTATNRQDMFDLSRQRAALYNTTYQGASCPPGVPCL